MSGNSWIIIGVIATTIACFSLPYGFHLKAKEGKDAKRFAETSGDVIQGDKIAGSKFNIIGNVNVANDANIEIRDSNIKIVKLKVGREFQDYQNSVNQLKDEFIKQSEMVSADFNARGMSSSGPHIVAQMNLSRAMAEKMDQLWIKLDRGIQDILIQLLNVTFLADLNTDFQSEINTRAALFDERTKIFIFFESFPKNWEKRIFDSDKITRKFKLTSKLKLSN